MYQPPIDDPLRNQPRPWFAQGDGPYIAHYVGTILRNVALAVFVVMFVTGFFPWLNWFGVSSHAGEQLANWAQWVVAMFGIGLTEIVRHLAAIRDSKGTAP